MKEKLKRISKSSWALILAVMMLVSSFSVLAATTNVSKTGAYSGMIYYHDSKSTGDVYIYSFGGNTTFGSWNTTKMDKLGDGYYSIEVPSTNTDDKVIFNPTEGSGGKTGDLAFQTDGKNMYDRDSDTWTTYGGDTPSEDITDDLKSVLNGDKIMFYIGNRWGVGTEYIYISDKANPVASTTTALSGSDSYGAVTATPAQYYVTHEKNGWAGLRMGTASKAGYKYITYSDNGDKLAETSSSGSATTTVGADNTISTDFTAGQSGAAKGYSLVYYLKDSSGKYSKVGTSANEVNTKIAELAEDTYTLYTCSTDGTVTVLRDTDTIAKSAPVTVTTGVKVSTDGATYAVSTEYTAPTGGGSVASGSSATLTASDITGYTFVGWEASNGDTITSTEKTVEYTPTSDSTVYAKYNKNYTVSIGDHENGTIKIDDAESNKTVSAGTQVTISATADTGYQFTAWTGALVGETEATVTKTVTDDMTVGATFSKASYTITKATTTNGSFTVTGENGAEINSANYGDTVTVTPTANDGYKVSSVKYNDTEISLSDGSYKFTMPAGNVTVSVTFAELPKYYIVGTIVNDNTWGTNKNNQMTYDSDTGYYSVVVPSNHTNKFFRIHDGSNVYGPQTASVKITTDPTEMTAGNKDFAYYIDGMTTGHVYTIYTDGKNVWYTDVQKKHNIKVDKPSNGTVEVNTTGEVGVGDTVTLTNTPADGYTLDSYKVYKTDDDTTTVEVTNGTFEMPDYDVTVTATFKKIDYTVTVSADPSALISSVSASKETANIGDEVTFTATDVEGYTFTGWKLTGATVADPYNKEITVTVGTENITAEAKYEVNQYGITKATATNGSFTVDSKATYGSTVTINTTPNTGYVVADNGVTVNITTGGSTGSTVDVVKGEDGKYTFTMPAGVVQVTVNFEKVAYTISNTVDATKFDLTVDKTTAGYGDEVSFTLDLKNKLDVLKEVTVKDASNNTVPLTQVGNKYTFTMPASNVTISATCDTVSSGYGLVGDFNEWSTDANVFVKKSVSTTSKFTYTTVTLEAGKTYEFKVTSAGKYYSNTTTITSANCTDISFSENESQNANAKITATQAGTYTFVWNTSTNKLSVIYPDAKYYVVGRFPYGNTLIDWEPTSTKIPFAYDATTGYYKYETGKTVSELSGTGGQFNVPYYFWVYDGSKHYHADPADETFQNNTVSNKKELTYKNWTDKQWLRFNDSSSTDTSPVTLWFDPVERTIWYNVITKVAKSVTLDSNKTEYYYGDSVELTATLEEPATENVKYTFTEIDADGKTVGEPIVSDTATVTVDKLNAGDHTYKVEVSADGYDTVSVTKTITVKKHDVAESVTASTTVPEFDYGSDASIQAVLNNKFSGYTGNVTYTLVDEDGNPISDVQPIVTNQTNVAFTVTKPTVGTHTYKVIASADNYNSVTSAPVTITVNEVAVTDTVTLTGVDAGTTYYVGDSVTLKANCNAPDGVTVNYNYYVNGKKINNAPTPNRVTYDFSASDKGSITFYAKAVADNYTSVKSDEISAAVAMKKIADKVVLTATPNPVKESSDLTITAKLDGNVQSGDFTYTFSETTANGDIQSVTSKDGSAMIVTNSLSVGKHEIKVVVSGTNFESIEATTTVEVKAEYTSEDVNKTSGKTMLISYDSSTSNIRNYVHTWYGDDTVIFNNQEMSNTGITGLYYKDYTGKEDTIGSNSINFIVKNGTGWNTNSSGDQTPSGFKVGKQWYILSNNTNLEYTPLTLSSIKVPTEINDDDSTKFELSLTGGTPYFFGKTVGKANDNAVYTVTITDPNGKVVGTDTFKYSAETTVAKFEGLTLTDTGKYTFTITDGIDTVSYEKDLTVEPLVVDNYKATVNASDNATITVTCKGTTITGGNTGELPEKKNATINVTGITKGYKIKSVSVKSGVTEIPITRQQYGTYIFTMPSSDVTITVDVVEMSKYQVNYGVSDKTNGSITAVAGSDTVKTGSRIVEGTEVTFTAKVTNSADYKIDGWYSDSSYKNKIADVADDATTYTTTVSDTTNVYVKISENPGELQTDRTLIIGRNDRPQSWTDHLPVYKKADGSYYVNFDISTLQTGNYYYALSSLMTGSISYPSQLYWQYSTDVVNFESTNKDAVVNARKDGGYDFNKQSRFNNYGRMDVKDTKHLTGLTLKITPNASNNGATYTAIPTVKTAPTGSIEVYAKDGTLLTTSGYGDTTVTGMNADCAEFIEEYSNYNLYAAMAGDRLTVTTVVNDDDADDGWYVSNYVINGYGYDAIETVTRAASTGKSYTISTPYSVRNTDTKLEITPIYKNKNVEAADDYITLYANAESLGDRWGNTISVYSYYYEGGSVTGTTKYMNSAYPGEPMMKQSNGLFVAYVPKNAWANVGGKFQKLDNYSVSGITFNNYKENETIHQKFLNSDQNKNYQTYDYDDFKYIAAAGYDTVLYDFEYRNATTSNQKTLVDNATKAPDKTGTTIDPAIYEDTTAHNGWDVLTNMDNEEVSLLGYTARVASTLGETFDSTNKLHIVSVGNINTTMGKWSTIWYVYDKDGNYVTQGLPSDFIPRYDTNADGSVSENESETQTDAYKAIKAKGYAYTGAYITYENEMDAKTSTETRNSGVRSDGRWYYSRAAEQVKVNTHVLYANDSDSATWTEDTYGSDYAGTFTGAKALVGTERSTTVDRNTEVSITASALTQGTATKQYKFIGWTTDATKGADGKFTVVQNPSMTDSSQTVKVSSNMDLYALYIPIAKGDLVISHEKYTGENAYGGPGRYFVQATLYDIDNKTVKATYYQEGSVTIPNYTENSGMIKVQLIVYSVNGSRYKETYNYQFNKITDQTHVDMVCSSNNPAVVERTINASDIFTADGKMKTNKVDFYSDLQTNNITVKMNYYNRKIVNGQPADLDSTPTSYSYRFTSYPSAVLDTDGNLSIPQLIEYAKNHTQTPDSMIERYISWNSQADALAGITSYYNYHTSANYESTPYHTDKYGNVQSSGEKWVTYYDRNGVEVTESEASAETVSSISIWYFNTPKKYTYTMNIASTSDDLVQNGDIYYGNATKTVSNLFYNTRLFASDKTISDASSSYTQGYGVDKGYTTDKVTTAETIDNGGTTLKFLYWAYDTAGKNVASTNIEYGLRITNNTKLYAIYGETELKAPGLTVSEVAPDTFFDSNNISKTRINTLFNPYNCKDNDKNINDVSVVYLRVANQTTAKSINNMSEKELLNLRKQISTVVSKAQYEKFKSGEVDSDASAAIVQITGSTASGFKFKVVDQVSEGATELQTSLSNKNRGQFTTTFTTSTLRNYTYYVFATMGYKNYNGDDSSVVTKSIDGEDVSYITSTNFVKYSFNENGKYTG